MPLPVFVGNLGRTVGPSGRDNHFYPSDADWERLASTRCLTSVEMGQSGSWTLALGQGNGIHSPGRERERF